jgi:hypothetical protein
VTRYRVLVADRMLEFRHEWPHVEGYRLAAVGEPWFDGAPMRVCEFEDDGAPPELEGKLVNPVIRMRGGVRRVTSRVLVT